MEISGSTSTAAMEMSLNKAQIEKQAMEKTLEKAEEMKKLLPGAEKTKQDQVSGIPPGSIDIRA